ncbi:hypothetical protein D3C72_1242310 [compost metagenome]
MIVQTGVDRVVAGFGNPPRHVALASVIDLRLDDGVVGLVKQGVRVVRHDQERHQVLEHRAAPRQQHGLAGHHAQLAAQGEPVLLRQLALGDGDEAGQAHFGSKQIVVAGVQAPFADVVADGQQFCRRVVQEAIFDLREVARLARRVGDVAHVASRLFAALRQQGGQLRLRAFRRFQVGQFTQGRHAHQRHIDTRVRRPRRQLQQLGQRRAALARQGSRPHGQLAILALQGQRQQRVGRAIRGGEISMPFGQAGGRRRRLQQVQAVAHGLALAFGGDEFLQYLRRRADALHHLPADDRGVIQLHQSRLQGQQVAGQVAAVDR